jgi:GNAT superfamily N-acetyltransferase
MTSGGRLHHRPVPIAPDHDFSEFDCGEPHLDAWLRQRATNNEGRFSRTYVITTGARVIGYYCLSAATVERAAAPSKLRRNAPDLVPVALIGRLAVDRAYAGQGLGADLLADGFRRVASASQSIGLAAVMVHAKTDGARRFYLACAGFSEFPPDSSVLFLSMEKVVALFT